MIDKKKESLLAALQYCSLRSLPDVEDGENVWVQALALVAKRDGTTSYVLVEKNGRDGSDKIIKDFGSISMIVKFLEFYPTMYLYPEYVPEFDNNKKESRINYLRKNRGDEDYGDYTLKELNKLVICTAIQMQLNSTKHN
jgi:hypothetical protein